MSSKQQNIEDIYPLSPAQQGMLMVLLLGGYRSEVYFEQVVATLSGPLDAAAWERAWREVVRRHPALRTQFVWERREQPLQVVRRDAELPWTSLDWSGLPDAEREERLAAFLRDDHAQGFDLGRPPLTRIALIRWAEEVHKLVWSFHHLVLDGWSISLVLSEAMELYAAFRQGRAPQLAPPRPYRGYVAWLQRQDAARAEAFWRRTLDGFATPTPLPFDGTGAQPEESSGWASTQERRELAPHAAEALEALARRNGLTLNTLVQGAWGLLLARLAGGEDVAFGAVVSGRPAEVEGIDGMAGLFINALPVRVRIDSGRELVSWLRELQAAQTEMREFEHCLLEQVQAWSEVPRHAPLFESLLVFQNYPVDPLGLGDATGFRMTDSRLKESTHYPLTCYVTPEEGTLRLRLAYHWNRFDGAAARRVLEYFAALLEGIAEAAPEARLSDLPLVSAEERRALLAAGIGPVLDPPQATVCRQVLDRAARTPLAVAVESSQGALTYGELARRSTCLARHLRRLGVGPESVVGLCVERSPEMIVGMLGVLEAGGAYLPLDPAYPAERLGFMLEDAGARVLLTQERLLDRLPVWTPGLLGVVCLDADRELIERDGVPQADRCCLHHPAYVIYTSGSTGRPKGVVVEHRALATYVASAAREHIIGPGDRVLQFASMSFDTSAEEIYPCLTQGATLVLRDGAMAGSPEHFLNEVGRLGITVLDLPTAYWHELVAGMAGQGPENQDLELPRPVRLVILGGEQAQTARLAAWRERVGGRVRLLNTYGPTEATIVSTWCDLSGSEAPIGRPVPNARVFVVGRDGNLVPQGIDGELWIGGAGLARGYLGRPDLTAERFVPDPFGAAAGERLYRTGDLVRLLPTGDLEFRGRVDHQVKVRGFRIELGEVETALRNLPGVREAVALVRGDTGGVRDDTGDPGDRRLVGYVAAEPGATLTVAGLREGLKAALPDHMVPTAFVLLETMPLTPSGKLDRRALPAPGEGRPELGADFAAPRTPVEEVLAGIFAEVLRLDRVGVDDDFFVLGGHSLLVGQVVTRVRQALRVELPMGDLFRRPTVAGLAELIEKAETGTDLPQLPPIVPVPRDGRPLPLSFPQERVWFLDQLSAGGNIAYNFQVAIWFHGPLDVPVLERSLAEIVRRHEVLRTSFPAVDGLPVQVVHPAGPVTLPIEDLTHLPESGREAEAERRIDDEVRTPFDVSRAPLIRWRLLRLAPDHHALVQVEHHFVHDGWSFGVLLRELKAIYAAFLRGEPSPLPELPVQYGDFAVWQRSWMEGEAMERLLGFWRGKLAGGPTPLELPGDRPRPARPSFQGKVEMFLVRPDLYDALRRFSRREGFTLYMTMLAGFLTLLHRYTGNDDVLIGTSNANRRAREIEGMIGMVVNTLVLRGDLSGEPGFKKLLGRVRELTLEVYAHQDMPFERLVKDLKIERQIGRNPLFQIMFNFHDAGVPDLDFGGGLSAVTNVRGNRSAKMDMNVIVVPRAEQRVGLADSELNRRAVLHWEWNTELYDQATIERMVEHFQTLLAGVIASPDLPLGELPLLTEAERAQLAGWADTVTAFPREATIPALFEACVEAAPGAVAVESRGDTLTYAELNRRANRLAWHLRELGVGPGDLVGLCVRRSLELVPAILGILKSGAAYAPLDPGYPAERLAWMLEDTGARVLVGPEQLLADLPDTGTSSGAVRVRVDADREAIEARSAANPLPLAGPGDLAYVMYTSGSTGRPKGVAVTHRNVVRMVRETNFARFGPEEVFLQLAPLSFDASTLELWGPLLHGGRLVVFPSPQPSLEELGEVIARHGVTSLWLTAGLFHQMVEGNLEGLRPVRQLLAGGDVLSPAHVRRVLAELPGTTLINGYGPTEGTTFTCCHAMTAESRIEHTVPIGRPIANTRVYVVDAGFRQLPVGIPGELLLGGDGLAAGYWRRPELTAERFVPDPFGAPGGRLYRTGDQVRWLADGAVEFLGRRDGQVKVRGFRIEPGEIEAALAEHPAVREAAVVAREDAQGERRLVAYVAADGDPDLRGHLEGKLPAHMVPSAWVFLDALPLTANGKVDRRALPAPEAPRAEHGYVAPRTPSEEAVAAIWREVLGVERVGVHDDFFLLGGHSLSATRVVSRLRQQLGAELSLAVVFECSTLEALAAAVDEVGVAAGEDRILAPVAAEVPAAQELSDEQLDALLAEMMPSPP
jgi:amino acid adenylation domain-containing protein